MYFLVFEVNELATDVQAFVSCWINSEEDLVALTRAKRLIEERGWSVIQLLEQYQVSIDNYPANHEGLPYYEQALIDDEVAVFFVVK